MKNTKTQSKTNEIRSKRMFDPIGAVSIALGSVVLDRPDQTGRYFAKDLAGGWAYLVGDADGDARFRGHGVCDGGLDTTLRCAFLSALNRIPECGQIRILVESRQAHRMMVQLARRDPHVVAAIAGRPVSVMTRPEERSSFQVRSAAERAAAIALREREHAEWHRAAVEEAAANAGADQAVAEDAAAESAEVVDDIAIDTLPRRFRSGFRSGTGERETAGIGDLGPLRDWRAWRSTDSLRDASGSGLAGIRSRHADPLSEPSSSTASNTVRGLVGPLLEGARNRLAAAGLLAPRPSPRGGAVMQWLQDFDSRVAAVSNDLQDAGA
jgi:hypothetical protein